MKSKWFKVLAVLFLSLSITGCTFVFQTGRRSDVQKIEELSAQLEELNNAKKLLEERLGKEIQDKQVSLKMMEKGLVITVVGDLLFDSGKDKIRPEAYNILDKVATVLNENVPQNKVGIEGHTDNTPIKFSGWKSNWELSTARALSVLHYLVNKKDVSPDRLTAIGYGEFNPVSTNDTREGRQLNRRVEIVILPAMTKVKEGASQGEMLEPSENLK
ncbi:MAG: flagellar motor protein MotB [Candidatus Omnitrophica bacterium]|nr:flagellar motor protein MotB [Candidatus Omnitrophota bacterium]MDD5652789.1 flagellar motor protein MotB [Candidatus Omnitrophota bacterium]